ncbi:Protein phosphatase 1G [Goodea atripinnis]|uniref:Protein phosphatase 1G n=1 Tax=Goodea atripinnis TaxID=208336 RepID=A0ABV0N6Y7_9TELE
MFFILIFFGENVHGRTPFKNRFCKCVCRNVLSSQEVVDFIAERIKPDLDGKIRALSSIVEELLDHCLAPDTSGDGTGCDNMTCMIVTFRPHPAQSDDMKKRKLNEEENGNDSKKAKSN